MNLLNVSEGMIDGVIVTPLKILSNEKGNVFHAMKISDPGYSGFEEAYFSEVIKDEIKGWKKHTHMTLNLIVIVGSIKFVLYDDREESTSRGKIFKIELSRENYNRLTIPPNVWVSFSGKGVSNILLNISNMIHDPKEAVNISIEDFIINKIWQNI